MIDRSKIDIKLENINPLSRNYIDYWKDIKRKCIEGFWIDGIYIPGYVYFYRNFWKIKRQRKEGKGEIMDFPDIRDIEWEKSLIYMEAKGFSGFSLDNEYTCETPYSYLYRRNKEYYNLSDSDLKKLILKIEEEDAHILNIDWKNVRKKYVSPREYLSNKKGNWGKPLYNNDAQNVMEIGCRGYGKELADYEPVITELGYKNISDCKIGDSIYDNTGKLTTITGVFPQGIKPIYRIHLTDKRYVDCGLEHLWGVFIGNKDKRYKVLTTKEILNSELSYEHRKSGVTYKYYLPEIDFINFPKKNLSIHPYILGCLLGDGTTTSKTPRISTNDEEILDEFKRLLPDYIFNKDKTNNNYNIVYKGCLKYKSSIYTNSKYNVNPLYRELINLKLNVCCEQKFIPDDYLYSSIEQRFELLKGLMDTDGSVNERGACEFTGVNKKLVEQVAFLCRSLGIRCEIGFEDNKGKTKLMPQGKYCRLQDIYRLYIRTDLPIFKLSRKLNRIKKRKNTSRVAIKNIEYIGEYSATCIMVNNHSKLFLTRDCIVTHNSYFMSSIGGQEFLLDGATDYEVLMSSRETSNPLTCSILIGAIDTKWSGPLVDKITKGIMNIPGSQTYNSKYYPAPLTKITQGSLSKAGDKLQVLRKIKIDNSWVTEGSGSIVHHRSFHANPEAGAGLRCQLIVLDEVGYFEGLYDALANLKDVTEVDGKKFGIIWMTGTSGDMESGVSTYAQKVFNNPEKYKCLTFENVYESNSTQRIGYFVPAWKKLEEFRNNQGFIPEENKEKAINRIKFIQEQAKLKSQREYSKELQNNPLTPSQAFLVLKGNRFPVAELEIRLSEVLSNENLLNSTIKGEFREIKEDKIELIHSDKNLIIKYHHNHDLGVDTPIAIYELPKTNPNTGKIYSDRYIAGFDPVEDDGKIENGHSLQSMIILDLWTDRIVAEYTGRTYLVKDGYEQLRLCLKYYNALCNYEKDKKGPYQYFESKQSLHLMSKTPAHLEEKGIQKIKNFGNEAYGSRATTKLIDYGLDLILEWLEAKDGDTKKMHTIKSPALLEELIAFNPQLNCDRIMALVHLMVLREEKIRFLKIYEEMKNKEVKKDTFWEDTYYKPNYFFYNVNKGYNLQ